LGTTQEFVKKNPNTARAVTAAILEAGKWIDASLSNKNKMADTIAQQSYVNTSREVIIDRILGRYQNGLGRSWDDANHMKFSDDGAVNFPYLSDATWFMTQHRRWGLLKDDPDYLAVAKQVNQIELYKQAATMAKIAVPKSENRSSKMIDGVIWDGSNPKQYANSFKIKNV
jgi:nitrate/nitrite transport system substrate-binding protein